jgi:hypothetical protein
MPHDMDYGDNDCTLRAFLTAHFENIIKDEYQRVRKAKEEAGDFDDVRGQ